MGQIQNAVLNALGSVQQMAQLYKLTDAYVEQQENKAAEAKQKSLEQDVKTGKLQMTHQQTRSKLVAGLREGGFTDEQKAQYKKDYEHFSGLTQKEIGTAKRELTNQIKRTQAVSLDPNNPELIDLYSRSEYLSQQYPAGADKKAKANKSPQEQADSNSNIKAAKNAAKGGKK